MDDSSALVTSNAGMRLMAQQMLYNRGDFERLAAFISESYTAEALDSQPADQRLTEFEARLAEAGKMRVQQVLATEKHHVIVLMAAQANGAFYLYDITVEEDYPHKITAYSVQPLEDASA